MESTDFMQGIVRCEQIIEIHGLVIAGNVFFNCLATAKDDLNNSVSIEWIDGFKAGLNHYRLLESKELI